MNAPSTPYLRVDVGRLDRNIERVAARAAEVGVTLRPHAKTHKSPAIAARQLAAGSPGLTVATIGEAEVFAQHGCPDLFIAYPVYPDQAQTHRLRRLQDSVRLRVGVDSLAGAQHLATRVPGMEVLVEIDSGHRRTGVLPHAAGSIAAAAAEAGLTVMGCFTFPGHSYAPDQGSMAAQQERQALALARDSLAQAGLDCPVLSGGSTPSLPYADSDVLTEWRPGVYVFGDAQQWELGDLSPEDIALTCVSTVVSVSGSRVVLDAGSKILGADRAAYATGFGRVLSDAEARIVMLSEHHAVVEVAEAVPRVGDRLPVVPNHVCAAVNLVDYLWFDDGTLTAVSVTARGHNC